jgi:hypothetical protein
MGSQRHEYFKQPLPLYGGFGVLSAMLIDCNPATARDGRLLQLERPLNFIIYAALRIDGML